MSGIGRALGRCLRRLRVPVTAAGLTLTLLVASGFASLQLLHRPKLSARLAARAVATVAHERLVGSVELVARRPPLLSVCRPGRDPSTSVVWFDTGSVVRMTPGWVVGRHSRARHELLVAEALLAGCPRELERLLFQRVALRFEHGQPMGLRHVRLNGEPAFELVFEPDKLHIGVVLNGHTLRPEEILLRGGGLRARSVLEPVVRGRGGPLGVMLPE